MSQSQTGKLVVRTWNPFTGCTKISPACRNCYAEVFALKLKKWGTAGYEDGFKFTVHHDRLEKAVPLHRKKPTLYFINNMSDTFHEDACDKDIDQLIKLVLSGKPIGTKAYFEKEAAPGNLWLGVTVEDRKHGLPQRSLARKHKKAS